jgi:formate dehydrogenase
LLAVLVDEGLLADRWLADHANGLDELRPELARIPIADWCERGGLAEEDVRTVARRIATAKGGVSIFEDLGIQQAPHSTLCSYLEKLLYLLTGNFGVPGAMNIHTKFANIAGNSGGRGIADPTSPVTGERIITSLIPAAALPDEILTDHPDRFRAMIVESGNPVHSLPDSPRMREALDALDLVVVIDVALTETGRGADYILPASSQYEKWEATFFTLEFPENAFHLRRPLLDPLPGTLPEPEIHARLVRASGAFDDHEDALEELRAAAASGRAAFFEAFLRINGERSALAALAPVVLYETLGPSLGEQGDAAGAWGLAQMTTMAYPQSVQRAGFADGDALFDAVLSNPSGVVFSIDEYEDTWRRVETPDGKVALVVDELLEELRGLHDEPGPVADPDFPFVLSAGERRSSTANTIFRDPGWRRKDPSGALRLSTTDAEALGIAEGDAARVTTRRGSAVAVVEVTDTLLPGHASLPNGFGVGEAGDSVGVAPNELTSGADRDWLAGTPHHKHVPARIERLDPQPMGAS